ncbi:MAG: 5'-3' exonuclease H3TH domain-containing protein [Planctomycetota bacterium]
MKIHLIDGTYELFRHYFAVPSRQDASGHEVGALTGVVHSVLTLLRDGATHIGVATDHVIESYRNELWPAYKSGEGIEPELLSQFHPLEDVLRAAGVMVWPMVEVEADDALAAAAAKAAEDARVEQVFICTPDKDLGQCVVGDRVVQWDRRRDEIRNADGVHAKFGVRPESIPDYLALVGDAADGFPGIEGWGAKSTATVLDHYQTIDAIPADPAQWDVKVRGAARLAKNLEAGREHAMLFKKLAILRTDVDVFDRVEDLAWRGPTDGFTAIADALGSPELALRAAELTPTA